MTKQAVIKIEGGSFESGFPVFLEFWQDGRIIATDSNCPQLPPNPQIPQVYEEWREIYTHLGDRIIKIPDGQTTHASTLQDCQSATQTLESTVKTWFSDPIFGDIRGRIVGQVKDGKSTESVRIILDTSNAYLRKLSWDRWDLFEKSYFLPQAEFTLLSSYNRPTEILTTPLNILAIFGSHQGGLKLQEDRELIETLKKYGANITAIPRKGNFLSPQELFDKLWMGNWDIIFYAGHSSEKQIQVDHSLNLSIEALKEALKKAAKNVKLAVFNSCDGLGIAEYLADFEIPHLIVMREPVPDQVARTFLKFFLEEFIQGKPLHAAVRSARQHLQQIEIPTHTDKLFYPGASWLPVLSQNPAASELYWPQTQPDNLLIKSLIKPWQFIPLSLVLMGTVLYGVSQIVSSEKMGDQISQGEEILTPFQPRDKQRGVKPVANCQRPWSYFLPVWNGYVRQRWIDCFISHQNSQQAVRNLQESWQEERKDPETLIYLNNALLEAIGADYYTIAVVVPILKKEVIDAEIAEELLRGIAQAQTEVNLSLFNQSQSSDLALPGADFLDRNNLNGKGLKVIIADDSNLETQARTVATTLAKRSEILGVVGHYTSEMTMATVDIYNQNKKVLVSPGTTTSELSTQPRKIFFRIPTVNHVQANVMVDVLLNQINQKRVAIFYNPASPYSSDYKKQFKEKFLEKGGYIIDSFDLSTPDFNAERAIQKIRDSGESAIVLMPDGQVTNSLARSLEVIKENLGQSSIVGTLSLYSPKALKIAKPKLLEKLILLVHWHYLSSPNPDFSKTALQLWGGPVSPRTALAYDAALVLIEGIRQHPTRRGVRQAIADQTFGVEGVTGPIEFIPGIGDRQQPPVSRVWVVPCPNREFGFAFLPIQFATAEAAGLNCSNP